LTLVVLLSIDPDRKGEFERFEERAASIMSQYGGRIARRICFPFRGDPSQPHELHLVVFPDRESFDRYRRDPDLQALAGLRAAAIRQTVIWEGVDSPVFGRGNR
jgi:uncharacterized protein (DUF1330 family)